MLRQLVTGKLQTWLGGDKKHIAVSLLRVGAGAYLRQSISDNSILNLIKHCGFTVSAELREHLFPLCSLLERCSSSILFSSMLPSIDVRSRVSSSGDFSVHLKSGSWILISCLFADSSCVCVRAVATLAVKSCKNPRAQLLHVIDRLVGMNDIDYMTWHRHCATQTGRLEEF